MSTVLLTGASGFLGAHTVQHLLERDHRVRAFVRTPARLDDALLPLGLSTDDDRIDVATGDMTDAAAVREAVAGCDTVVHAAATYSFRRRDGERMLHDNAVGTRTVLEAGRDAGCRTLVHVSSTVALTRPGRAVLDERSPVGPGHGPYSASKVASEQVARELQGRGAPVTIVYPGSIVGPHDPYLGETNELVLHILQGRLPVFPRGQLPYVDVRDTAAVIAAAAGHAPGGRYVVPGTTIPSPHAHLREITGRRVPVVFLPSPVAVAATWPGYVSGLGFLPGAIEGVHIAACANSIDAGATTGDLGVEARPLRESLTDTVRWLVDAGHLRAKAAGRAVGG